MKETLAKAAIRLLVAFMFTALVWTAWQMYGLWIVVVLPPILVLCGGFARVFLPSLAWVWRHGNAALDAEEREDREADRRRRATEPLPKGADDCLTAGAAGDEL